MELKFAPRAIFEQILEFAVIPTFDLVIEVAPKSVIIVRRKIAPYKDVWALPGLRMYKPEGIEDALTRIARVEVGLAIDASKRRFLGQFVGRFRTEHQRQDLSTGFAVRAKRGAPTMNEDHFTDLRLIRSAREIPKDTGAMYRYYLKGYFGAKP